ncbi:MAG TPA: hypothetical protein VK907_04960 [Phnomibacter sp.]|nr:hypothetical protein [Phnomibacter sp.]
MAKLKAEFLQHYYNANGVPLRSRLIANFSTTAALGSLAPWAYNFFMTAPLISTLVKKISGFAPQRSMPTLQRHTLRSWFNNRAISKTGDRQARKIEGEVNRDMPMHGAVVYLFVDEFTNYNDTHIGIRAIELLERLGYRVRLADNLESGRTWLSKGMLKKAKKIADENITRLSPLIDANHPLLGIEPSAFLTFRDEYPDLCDSSLISQARELSANSYTIEEFLVMELARGHISPGQFTTDTRKVLLHGHCQQKAVGSMHSSVQALSLPANYYVEVIPSGCCGMAGSFGYEKEHYDISMKIGELVLLPAVRQADTDTLLAAPGTSCRHQIKDGAGRKAMHPVEILWEALA